VRFCLSYTSAVCWTGDCVPAPNNWGSTDNLGWQGSRAALASFSWNVTVVPERLTGPVLAGFGVFLLCLFGWHLRQLLHGFDPYRQARVLLISAAAVFWLFCQWWLPNYEHPFLTVWFLVLLLTLLAVQELMDLPSWQRNMQGATVFAAVAVVAIVAARNYQARIQPLRAYQSDSYLEAMDVAAMASPGCKVLASYRVWSHLRYYFETPTRPLLVKSPMVHLYRGEPVPEMYSWRDTACLVIATQFLNRDFPISGYREPAFDGRRDPEQWTRFITYLFDADYDQQGALRSHRSFRLVPVRSGGHYLVIGPERVAAEGVSELVRNLEHLLESCCRDEFAEQEASSRKPSSKPPSGAA
jgi:hypothetical protein